MRIECAREDDVLDMLAAQRWPRRCDAELMAHISECRLCDDLVTAAAALRDDQDRTWREARVPASSLVWWRAQSRAREEAARAAVRPIAFVQGVAAASAVWIAVSMLRAFPIRFRAGWHGLAGIVRAGMPDVSALMQAVPGGAPLLMAVAASILLAPVVLFFVVREVLREQ
jgi:hypothetical protein